MKSAQSVHFESTGEQEPSLLFVHGFCCSHDDWQAQVAALSPEFRCVALDLPGHGQSPPPEHASFVAMGKAINAVKRQSAAKQTVLIGHSMGAKVIREAYCQDASGVIGMVFIEGAFYSGPREPVLERARSAIDEAGFHAFAQHHFGDMFIESSDPRLREQVLARIGQLDARFATDLYLEAVGWDALRGRETLRAIKVPTLVLQSSYNDAQLKRQPLLPGMKTPFMTLVAETLVDADIKAILGCGHFTPIEAADQVNREIRAFTKRISHSSRDSTS